MLVRASFTPLYTYGGYRQAIRRLLAARGKQDPRILEVIIESMQVMTEHDLQLLLDILAEEEIPDGIQVATAKKAMATLNKTKDWSPGGEKLRSQVETILAWLGDEGHRLDSKKELDGFLHHCWAQMPGRDSLGLNPTLTARASVKQRAWEIIELNFSRPESRAAIPFLWRIATTFPSGLRISLDEAIRSSHQLHVISLLQLLYTRTHEAVMKPLGQLLETKPELLDNWIAVSF